MFLIATYTLTVAVYVQKPPQLPHKIDMACPDTDRAVIKGSLVKWRARLKHNYGCMHTKLTFASSQTALRLYNNTIIIIKCSFVSAAKYIYSLCLFSRRPSLDILLHWKDWKNSAIHWTHWPFVDMWQQRSKARRVQIFLRGGKLKAWAEPSQDNNNNIKLNSLPRPRCKFECPAKLYQVQFRLQKLPSVNAD